MSSVVGVSIFSGTTQSESQEPERFNFFWLCRLRSAYDLLKTRLPESGGRRRRINQSLISMFSKDRKLYTSDYNPISNSVASENQP